jgi:hypothetical protein
MNSSNQGNSQGQGAINQQGASAGSQQGGARSEPNFVLVDADPDFDSGDEQRILGEVRRADRTRNRQSAEEQNQQGGQNKSGG